MDDLHFPGLLARPAKSQILVLGAQKYALKKKKDFCMILLHTKMCELRQGGVTSPFSSICILKAEAARLL